MLSSKINLSLNLSLVNKYPGITKSNIDQSSIKLFSIGVPVKAILHLDLIFLTDKVACAAGFFIFCASSIMQ